MNKIRTRELDTYERHHKSIELLCIIYENLVLDWTHRSFWGDVVQYGATGLEVICDHLITLVESGRSITVMINALRKIVERILGADDCAA